MIEDITAFKLSCDVCGKTYWGNDGDTYDDIDDLTHMAKMDGWQPNDAGDNWACDSCNVSGKISKLKNKYNEQNKKAGK